MAFIAVRSPPRPVIHIAVGMALFGIYLVGGALGLWALK